MKTYELIDELELINETIEEFENELDMERNTDFGRYCYLGTEPLRNIMKSTDDYIKCLEKEINKLNEYKKIYLK